MDSIEHAKKVYKRIKDCELRSGVYRKTIFHLHTPASYDYRLCSEWKAEDYGNCSVEDVIELCYSRHVVPESFNLYDFSFEGELEEQFLDKKEWLSYLLIAGTLFQNKYEVVLVSDHNTLSGIEKVKNAVVGYYKAFHKGRKEIVFPEVICGVEISCADRFHVVGIFESKEHNKVKEWMEENIISEEYGTFKTSFDVIQFFQEIEGFAYIAHINSKSPFGQKQSLGAGYKQKLIEAGCFDLLGIHEAAQADSMKRVLNNHGVAHLEFIIDNDAHSIDEMPSNHFWLKTGKRRNYKAVKEALEDYYVSVSLTEEHGAKQFIYGIYIEEDDRGFMSGKQAKGPFVVRFSDALNCFIGGRGTGKSTVLQIMDYALGQGANDEYVLNFICRNGNVWILYIMGNKEYLINMNLPYAEPGENVLRYFGENEAGIYGYNYHFDTERVKKHSLKKYLTIYEINSNNSDITLTKVSGKKLHLDKMYDAHYSVNRLVQTASGEEINDFIRKLMFQDVNLSSADKSIRARKKTGLIKAIQNIELILQKRSQEVHEVIDPFNDAQKNIMKIEYVQTKEPTDSPDFSQWLFGTNFSYYKPFKSYAISQEGVIEYLAYIYRKEKGIFGFLRVVLDPEAKRNVYSVKEFCDLKDPERRLNDDEQEIKSAIFDDLMKSDTIESIIQYLKIIVGQIEEFRLLFNINSSTTSNKGEDYRNIRNLSLGQKVVAMLDFILGYGTYIGDKRPLIIDQPEDNLDNQYIYHNLVKQLRKVKQERQVIIATHNATIVTNAMTDQVCVMNSDGKHGWVERTGYPSEEKIKRDIVNYLEGGVESFKHKSKIYRAVLK